MIKIYFFIGLFLLNTFSAGFSFFHNNKTLLALNSFCAGVCLVVAVKEGEDA